MSASRGVENSPEVPRGLPGRWVGARLRGDPWPVLCASVALVVYVAHGFDGALSRDVAVYAYAGQRVAEGVPPYEGIINRSGPLAHVVPGVGATMARMVGVDDLLAMRMLFMAISVACVVLAYVLGRDLLGSRMAGAATAAALLCLQPFIGMATEGPREKTVLVLFVLGSMLAVVHRRWLSTGCLVALATLTWQVALLTLLPGVVVALLLGTRSGRVRDLGRVAVGGLTPLAGVLVLFALAGSLRLFWDCFALINIRYTRQPTFFDSAGENVRQVQEAFGWSLAVLVVGMLALLALGAVDVMSGTGRRARERPALLGATVTLVATLLWSVRAFNNWPDSFVLMPSAALGIGGVASVLAARVRPRAAMVATVVWVVAATTASLTFSLVDRDDELQHQRAQVTGVLGALPPGSRIISLGAPQALVLADRRNPTRFQMIGTGLADYIESSRRGGLEGYTRWIDRYRPAVIVTVSGRIPDWLVATLRGPYTTLGTTTDWRWSVRRDVAPATKEAIRQVLGTARAE